MKNFFSLIILLAVVAGCTRQGPEYSSPSTDIEGAEVLHDCIVLGERLDDPYSVQNMTKALASVAPSARVTIEPTDYYVRFLPHTEKELQRLLDRGLRLVDHPLDYSISRDGDWYHDPGIPEGEITWQYAVVPVGFNFPSDIKYEKLDECYIASNDPSTKSDGIDWEAVEREAYRLTGNEAMLLPPTKAGSSVPTGRIAIMDPDYDDEPTGVKGVRVMCNSFVKFGFGYTDGEGCYKLDRGFNSNVRYNLVFQNEKGFRMGVNLILLPASVSTLGKRSPEGFDIVIDRNSDRKLFTRCVVNNAGYDYCTEAVGQGASGLPAPPANLRLWLFQGMNGGLCPMMQQGVIIDTYGPISNFLGIYAPLVKLFMPDVFLGLSGADDYKSVYARALHVFAHGSHYSRVGKEWWHKYVEYSLTSYISSSFSNIYGSRDADGSAYCEMAEIFAYYVQSALYRRRYGDTSVLFGTGWWFSPQLLMYLDERGLGLGKLAPMFTADISSTSLLKEKLLSYYPEYKSVIIEAFARY